MKNKVKELWNAKLVILTPEEKDALTAPTETKMKCQYCYPEYPSMDYQKFNYCPHCGRKLGDE
jgi:rRNA maturation endonuclease Nob1